MGQRSSRIIEEETLTKIHSARGVFQAKPKRSSTLRTAVSETTGKKKKKKKRRLGGGSMEIIKQKSLPGLMKCSSEGSPKPKGRRSQIKDTTVLDADDIRTEFADSIHVLHAFWQENMARLFAAKEGTVEHDTYTEVCMLFYSSLFKRLPECRHLFLSVDVKKQALLYMGMMGWLVHRLAAPNAVNVLKILKRLGKRHMSAGVTDDMYPMMLEALHETFVSRFPSLYTTRVRFCWAQLFNVCSEVMLDKDFTAKTMGKLTAAGVMEFITSFDTCIRHRKGARLLKSFMSQQFCVEMMEFYSLFLKFKGTGVGKTRTPPIKVGIRNPAEDPLLGPLEDAFGATVKGHSDGSAATCKKKIRTLADILGTRSGGVPLYEDTLGRKRGVSVGTAERERHGRGGAVKQQRSGKKESAKKGARIRSSSRRGRARTVSTQKKSCDRKLSSSTPPLARRRSDEEKSEDDDCVFDGKPKYLKTPPPPKIAVSLSAPYIELELRKSSSISSLGRGDMSPEVAMSLSKRDRIGRLLFERFIKRGAAMEVNLSHPVKERLIEQFRFYAPSVFGDGSADDRLPAEHIPFRIFDSAAAEVKMLIHMNVWVKFQVVMLDMCHGHELYDAWKAERTRARRSMASARIGKALSLVKDDSATSGCVEMEATSSILSDEKVRSPLLPKASGEREGSSTSTSSTTEPDLANDQSLVLDIVDSVFGKKAKTRAVSFSQSVSAQMDTPIPYGSGTPVEKPSMVVSPRAMRLFQPDASTLREYDYTDIAEISDESCSDRDEDSESEGFVEIKDISVLATPGCSHEFLSTPRRKKSTGSSAKKKRASPRKRSVSSARLSLRKVENPYSFLLEDLEKRSKKRKKKRQQIVAEEEKIAVAEYLAAATSSGAAADASSVISPVSLSAASSLLSDEPLQDFVMRKIREQKEATLDKAKKETKSDVLKRISESAGYDFSEEMLHACLQRRGKWDVGSAMAAAELSASDGRKASGSPRVWLQTSKSVGVEDMDSTSAREYTTEDDYDSDNNELVFLS